MKIISGTLEFESKEPTAVVLGKFDGIHIGHQLLLDRLLAQKDKGLKTVVFTFDKSPAGLFLYDGDTYRELYTLEEKRRIFEDFGVDILIEFPMNYETAAIPAEDFITEILQKKLNCKKLLAGEDVSFGHRGIGDRNMLLAYSQECGYEVEILDKVMTDAIFPGEEIIEEVSSTGIRKAINLGDVSRANGLMNRPFSIKGEVIHGKGLGGKLFGMPTINIKWPENKVVPAYGVYYTQVVLDGKRYFSITNVGQKPTVSEEEGILAETHLYDFEGDLYGTTPVVEFYKYVRPEEKFADFDALKEQLWQDMQAGLAFWKSEFPRN